MSTQKAQFTPAIRTFPKARAGVDVKSPPGLCRAGFDCHRPSHRRRGFRTAFSRRRSTNGKPSDGRSRRGLVRHQLQSR
jgi:hypothetical protein